MWVSFINDLTPNNHQRKSCLARSAAALGHTFLLRLYKFVVVHAKQWIIVTNITDWPTYSQAAQDFVFQRFDPYVETDNYRSAQINYINSIGQYLSH